MDCRDCPQPVQGQRQTDDDVQPPQQQPPSCDDLPDIDTPSVHVTRQHSFRNGDFQDINFPTAPKGRGRPPTTRTRFNKKRPKSTAFMDESDSGKCQ